MNVQKHLLPLTLLVLPVLYACGLVWLHTFRIRRLQLIPKPVPVTYADLGLDTSDATRRVIWDTTDPNKQLWLLPSPSVLVGPGYILRERFECWDNNRNRSIDLSLCFTASHALGGFRVNRRDGSTVRVLPDVAKEDAAFFTEADYTAFRLKEPRRPVTKHPAASLGDHDAWTRGLQKEIVQLAFELLDFLQIQWFVPYGAVLGTYRHLDQIPWDDDFDVAYPSYQAARLLGFFRRGNVNASEVREPFPTAAAQWWDWYVRTTPESVRREAERRYLTSLEFYVHYNPTRDRQFSSKIYWKDGPHDVHYKPWTFPFLDMFTFDYGDGKRTNAQSQRLVVRDHYSNIPIPAHLVFPLHERPLGHFSIPVPNTFLVQSLIPGQTALVSCWSGDFSHFYETNKRSYATPCNRLYTRIPFVTTRTHVLAPVSKLPAFPPSHANREDLGTVIEQQRNFVMLKQHTPAPPITQGSQSPLVLDPAARVLKQQWDTASATELFDALQVSHKPDVSRINILAYVPGVYEQLTVKSVIIAELVDVTRAYSELPALSFSDFSAVRAGRLKSAVPFLEP